MRRHAGADQQLQLERVVAMSEDPPTQIGTPLASAVRTLSRLARTRAGSGCEPGSQPLYVAMASAVCLARQRAGARWPYHAKSEQPRK